MKNLTLGTGTTNGMGEINDTITIPSLPVGEYLIEIVDATNKTDYQLFEMASMTATPPPPIPGFEWGFIFLGIMMFVTLYSYRKKRIIHKISLFLFFFIFKAFYFP